MSSWPSTKRAVRAHCLPILRAAAFTIHTEPAATITATSAIPLLTVVVAAIAGKSPLLSKGENQTIPYATACNANPIRDVQSRVVSRVGVGRFRSQNVNANNHQQTTTAQRAAFCATCCVSKIKPRPHDGTSHRPLVTLHRRREFPILV